MPAKKFPPISKTWTIDSARRAYAIAHWSHGYVDVDASGDLNIRPLRADGPSLSLPAIVRHAQAQGLRLPLLLRFTDILTDRLTQLHQAFARAMEAQHYPGGYTAIYPVKVNQQESVVSKMVMTDTSSFGLEAGSKPELMAVLGVARPGSIVICNGYKDRQYIRLALIGRSLGLRVYLVIEKLSELDDILAETRALNVEPLLGVRVRLAATASGNWQSTGGHEGKFGLSATQILALLERLDATGLKHTLRLQHFHMGSQISNVHDIAMGTREAARSFVELVRMGAPLEIMDVGGGLGVDYEGSRSRSFNSVNYSMEQYATTIVQSLAALTAEGINPPHILTEAGRAMTAHHAVLVVNVDKVEPVPEGAMASPRAGEPWVLQHMREIYARLDSRPALELYHEAQCHLHEGQTLYVQGKLTMAGRAQLEEMHYAIIHALRARLTPGRRAHQQVLDELDEKLVDKYFTNFSVFESIPDSWAIRQVFPVVPIMHLDRPPTRRGVIVDLTCDSDGRIGRYAGAEGVDISLPLHAPEAGQHYCLGIFMVGAYQEAMGNIHNLFADTDAVNVSVHGDSYAFTHVRRGDTTATVLDYVGYDLVALREHYHQLIAGKGMSAAHAARCHEMLNEGLDAYTYRSED